jgi:hypothetical protein
MTLRIPFRAFALDEWHVDGFFSPSSLFNPSPSAEEVHCELRCQQRDRLLPSWKCFSIVGRGRSRRRHGITFGCPRFLSILPWTFWSIRRLEGSVHHFMRTCFLRWVRNESFPVSKRAHLIRKSAVAWISRTLPVVYAGIFSTGSPFWDYLPFTTTRAAVHQLPLQRKNVQEFKSRLLLLIQPHRSHVCVMCTGREVTFWNHNLGTLYVTVCVPVRDAPTLTPRFLSSSKS